MDCLRNGPYRTCHTASGDVLMCYRGGLPALLQRVASKSAREKKAGIDGIDSVSESGSKYLNAEIRVHQKPKEYRKRRNDSRYPQTASEVC